MKLKNYILILLQAINLSHSGLNNIYEKNLQGVFSALVNDTSNNIFTPKVLKSLKEEVDKKIMSTQEETVFDSLKDELKKQTYFQLAFLKPDQQNLEEWSENLSTSILDFYNIDPSKKAKKIAIKGIAWDYLLTIFFEQKKSEEKRYTHPPNTDKNQEILKVLTNSKIKWETYWQAFTPYKMLLRKEPIFGLYGFIKYFEIMLDIDLTGFIMEHQIILPTFDTMTKIEALKIKMIEIQKEVKSIT